MKKDFSARIDRLQAFREQHGQELLVVIYKGGRKQRLTGHQALVEAIKNGDKIDRVEDGTGSKVDGLINALISEE